MTPAWRPEPKVASLPQRVLAAWDSYAGTQHLPAAAGACCGACRRPRSSRRCHRRSGSLGHDGHPASPQRLGSRGSTSATRSALLDPEGSAPAGAPRPRLEARRVGPDRPRRRVADRRRHFRRGPLSRPRRLRALGRRRRTTAGTRCSRRTATSRSALVRSFKELATSRHITGEVRDHAFRSHWRRRRRNGGRAGRASHSCPPRSRPPRR